MSFSRPLGMEGHLSWSSCGLSWCVCMEKNFSSSPPIRSLIPSGRCLTLMIIFRYDLIMAMASPPHTVTLREGMQTFYSNLLSSTGALWSVDSYPRSEQKLSLHLLWRQIGPVVVTSTSHFNSRAVWLCPTRKVIAASEPRYPCCLCTPDCRRVLCCSVFL